MLWCAGALNWVTTIPRDVSLSDSCTPDQCGFFPVWTSFKFTFKFLFGGFNSVFFFFDIFYFVIYAPAHPAGSSFYFLPGFLAIFIASHQTDSVDLGRFWWELAILQINPMKSTQLRRLKHNTCKILFWQG